MTEKKTQKHKKIDKNLVKGLPQGVKRPLN